MHNDQNKFNAKLKELLQDPKVLQMRCFPQHRTSNTLRHSLKVARESFYLAEKLGWRIREVELAKGALLHDYYLYDIEAEGISDYEHGISHPGRAVENALRDFGLTEKEQNIIGSHMWPLTIFSPPRSREALLVCVADKYVAVREMYIPRLKSFADWMSALRRPKWNGDRRG